LLVSLDFLNSEYCFGKEMQHALERHEAGTCRVIPIILRPTYWQGSPFSKLQMLPTDAKPIQVHLTKMKHPNRIRFVSLPTYAPWTNPTEKYWLKLSRKWLRFHPYARRQAHVPSGVGWLVESSL
jgi:hypothetical protein